ncbi:hypothetical protein BDV11DRAFT_206324 [Aspergillus similis]
MGLSLKDLPFMWHALTHHVFLPAVVRSRSPATEGDFNLHKSNSAYITDVDVSRAHFGGLPFAPVLLKVKLLMHCNLVECVHIPSRNQTVPAVRISRVASWDDEWIYMATNFVDNSKSWPRCFVTQANASISSKMTDPAPHKEERKKMPLDCTSSACFRSWRSSIGFDVRIPTAAFHTVTRTEATESANGCYEWTLGNMVSYKETTLPIVRLERGWDAVRELFREEQFTGTPYGKLQRIVDSLTTLRSFHMT